MLFNIQAYSRQNILPVILDCIIVLALGYLEYSTNSFIDEQSALTFLKSIHITLGQQVTLFVSLYGLLISNATKNVPFSLVVSLDYLILLV